MNDRITETAHVLSQTIAADRLEVGLYLLAFFALFITVMALLGRWANKERQ